MPAGTPVGLFAGHVFMGAPLRGDRLLALPPLVVRGVPIDLGINASASLGWSPSPTQAGLYAHTCGQGNLVAEWRVPDHVPPFAVLVAVSDGPLLESTPLCWNFDLHCVRGLYTLDDDENAPARVHGGRYAWFCNAIRSQQGNA